MLKNYKNLSNKIKCWIFNYQNKIIIIIWINNNNNKIVLIIYKI